MERLRKLSSLHVKRTSLSFFLNQLSAKHKVTYPKSGDFMVNEKYILKIGSKFIDKKLAH